MTFNEKLALAGGRPTGFDYMRFILAISVIVLHSVMTSYGKAADAELWQTEWRPFLRLILPMFFALSGFLVAGSLVRCVSLVQFLGLRFIRIYPALMVEVILSAFILGPLVTTVPLSEYFTDKEFFLYLINVTGHIHYILPGVFENNPFPEKVNVQLWTVPYELVCYIVLTAAAVFGITKKRNLFLLASIGIMLAYPIGRMLWHGDIPLPASKLTGFMLVQSFLFGVVLYQYADTLKWSWGRLVASFAVCVALLGYIPYGEYFAAPAIAYFTVCLGITHPKKIAFLKGADYSYGMFLYGFAIQQALVFYLPEARIWWVNITLAVPLSMGFAAISWHLVEKPALGLRKYLPTRIALGRPKT